MDKKSLITKLLGRHEIVDYSYAILFFLISSFFLVFAVKPALSIAFSLQRESIDLKRVNDVYERNILKLVDIQSNLEQIRDQLYLLDTAVPPTPYVQALVTDVRGIATEEGLNLRNFEITPINFKNAAGGKKVQMVTISMQTDGSYQAASDFIQKMIEQKRLKTISKIQMSRDERSASSSSQLRIVIETNGYYL